MHWLNPDMHRILAGFALPFARHSNGLAVVTAIATVMLFSLGQKL